MTSWSLRDLSGPLVPNAMRFPSILGFDGKGRARDVAELLRPCPSEGMRAYPGQHGHQPREERRAGVRRGGGVDRLPRSATGGALFPPVDVVGPDVLRDLEFAVRILCLLEQDAKVEVCPDTEKTGPPSDWLKVQPWPSRLVHELLECPRGLLSNRGRKPTG